MPYKLKFSKEAEKDLYDLFAYISNDLKAPQSANKLLAKIEKDICNLTIQPFMCPICQAAPLYEMSYRKLIIKKHIVIYCVDEKAKIVYIVRIFNGRQNYERFF
ncbi:MAG: type II toxin-antitoxin system RelE/ParE family toxin [Eubacterium sp.]|jgi:toxin ParE1/3/4|nr:type II toxin-antitoxin system RelE/ParE family toxin [Eubacterium sp.]